MTLSSVLGRSDPLPWLLASPEPAARWIAVTALADAATATPDRDELLRDPGVAALSALLPDWEVDNAVTAHDRPTLATNLLDLLFEIGVRSDDDPRIDRLLDQMLAHTDDDGRFQMLATPRGAGEACWGALLCDTHAILDILLAFGRGGDCRVHRALETCLTDLRPTEQGLAWPCRPSNGSSWRGPGRVRDCCPQTTLEALRAFSRLAEAERPAETIEVARTALGLWRGRATHKPYMFGHGRQFKQVKWPPTWYGTYEMVDVMGRLPEVWDGPAARSEDRSALAEVAACLLAYNVAPDGTVTPLSTFKGFEAVSFGQKKRPSPLATALVWKALKRLEPLAGSIAAVDVAALGSSKGGSGTPLPPRIAGHTWAGTWSNPVTDQATQPSATRKPS